MLKMSDSSFPIKSSYDFKLKKMFLTYMDSEGILNQLKVAGLQYKKNISSFVEEGVYIPPFRFIMKIDFLRMEEISNGLAMFFFRNPTKSHAIVEELACYALNVLASVKVNSLSDIHVMCHITSFPNIAFISDYTHEALTGLSVIRGILTGRTAAYKYTRSKVFFCKVRQCPNSKGKRYKPPFGIICSLCCSQMEEDVRSLDTGEEISGLIISSGAFSNSKRFQAVKIKIRDEICSHVDLKVGLEYNIIGTYVENHFIVWSIDKNLARFQALSNLSTLHPTPIPKTISDLYNRISYDCPNSPWSFVGAISSVLGSDILPVSSFLQLKMGMMLSLATQNSEDNPAPLVAIGADASAVQKLMKRAGQLAERFINYSADFEIGEKKYNAQRVWYEAGALILGTNGICNLGDWSRLRKDQCSYVRQAIESGKVILGSTDKNKTKMDFVPLKCAVWTYWCHFNSNHHEQLQLKMLLNVFGMPFLADEDSELEVIKICQKILFSMHDADEARESFIPPDELKEFISMVNSRSLVLNESASKLIHDFFVIIRKERPECLPVRAIRIITSLAEAHARISLRREIEYEDVIAVLYLYNQSITKIFGYPLITSKCPEFDESLQIYTFIHNKIQNFKTALERYLENYLFM